jgi:hypothetical protein
MLRNESSSYVFSSYVYVKPLTITQKANILTYRQVSELRYTQLVEFVLE